MKSAILACLCASATADIYMHHPRGSNNRNCRNDNNDERRNANRLFDSQNNADGGYSGPRAYPFLAQNNGQQATVDAYGNLNNADVDTETFSVYGGSEIQVEWTNQHGAGLNANLHTDVVIQYMTNTDYGAGFELVTNTYLRDGTPINNNDGDNTNDEATTRIGGNGNGNNAYEDLQLQNIMDGRYGYHESITNFKSCSHITRNKGLFTADQEMGGNRNNARYTRQENNANRYGLECNEERDYYPYWRPSPWHDIAVITSNVSRCEMMQSPFSQNLVEKCQCTDGTASSNDPAPLTKEECDASGTGQWQCVAPWNTVEECGYNGATWSCDEEPECLLAAYSRDNHLGNQMVENSDDTTPSDRTVAPATYIWNVPEFAVETKVVLRIRYNISTLDFDMDTTDSNFNGENSPIVDRDNREELSYYDIGLAPMGSDPNKYKLSITCNSDQYSRTFQDRSYVFIVKPVPQEQADCRNRIKNLNMRGKRGNIVQAYPSVEYDFVPQDLQMTEDDCLHIQWIGSDYNPNRNPNNGEGGPYNPNNVNEAKADRTNLVQIAKSGDNIPMHMEAIEAAGVCFFWDSDGNCDWDKYRKFALLDQDMATCLTVEQLQNAGVNNRQARERDPRNCGKLNARQTTTPNALTSTPHFDGGLQRVRKGEYKFVSTRNNNFSNRSQKMRITVGEGSSSKMSAAEIAGVTIGVLAAVGLLAVGASTLIKKRKASAGAPATRKAAPGRPMV